MYVYACFGFVSFVVVEQGTAMIVERLGKFHRRYGRCLEFISVNSPRPQLMRWLLFGVWCVCAC